MLQSMIDHLDVQALTTQLVAFMPRVIAALLIFLAFIVGFRVFRRPLHAGLKAAGLHQKITELLIDSLLRYTVTIVGLVMAAAQLGINVGAALAGLGVAGIAVGFAAQDTVANVISGIVIFLDKPFKVGDWIEVEGQYGSVSNITLRTTRIRTTRNTFVVIPNKTIIDAVLENSSQHGEIRIDVAVGIAYKEDIDKAREVLMRRISTLGSVMQDPAPDVVVDALGNSSVDLLVRVWIDDPKGALPTRYLVTEESKKALDEAGIQIPFPHLQLFLDSVENRVWDGASRVLAGKSSSSED